MPALHETGMDMIKVVCLKDIEETAQYTQR